MNTSSPTDKSDEALVRLTLEHGSQYFGNVVKRHSDYLYGLGMRLSNGNDALAKDMSQQAFIKAFKYLASFNSKHDGLGADRSKRFRNWLTGIAVNCCNDLMRTETQYVGLEQGQWDRLQQVPSADSANQGSDDFQAMIRPLSLEERQLITLRFVYEFTVDELAGMLGLKSGSVKSKISRAVARLRPTAQIDQSDTIQVKSIQVKSIQPNSTQSDATSINSITDKNARKPSANAGHDSQQPLTTATHDNQGGQ